MDTLQIYHILKDAKILTEFEQKLPRKTWELRKKISIRKATNLTGFNSLAKESVVMYEPTLIDLATLLTFR